MVKTLQKRGSSVKSKGNSGGLSPRDGKLSSGLHDLETARRHYSAMRDLIIRHRGGSLDERVLRKLLDQSRKAAAAVDDGNCRSLLSATGDRKSTRLNSSHVAISYAVFCLKKKK